MGIDVGVGNGFKTPPKMSRSTLFVLRISPKQDEVGGGGGGRFASEVRVLGSQKNAPTLIKYHKEKKSRTITHHGSSA